MRVDEASGRTIYAQIADSVRAGIADGSVLPGAVLPPARQVAASLGVNQHTVLHAYQLLRDEGLIDLRRGRGAIVSLAAASIAELYADATVLAARAAALGVASGTLAAIVVSASQQHRETLAALLGEPRQPVEGESSDQPGQTGQWDYAHQGDQQGVVAEFGDWASVYRRETL